MNATPAVSQAPAGAGSADSTRPSSGGQDFAAALSDAGPKPPVRKAAAGKVHGGRIGGQLPVPGNLSPPSTSPAALTADAAAAAAAGAAALAASAAAGLQGNGADGKSGAVAGGMSGAAAGTAISVPPGVPLGAAAGAFAGAAVGVAPGISPNAAPGAAAISTAQGKAPGLNSDGADLDAPPAAADAADPVNSAAGLTQALGSPGLGGTAATGAATSGAPAAAGAPAAVPTGAVPIDAAQIGAAADSAGGRRPIADALNASASAVKPLTGAAAAAATAAATSGAGNAGGTSSNSDATTQAPSAAALAAAVSGALASSDAGSAGDTDSPSVTDDLAAPATGAAQDAGGLNGAAAAALAGTLPAGAGQTAAVQAAAAMAHAAAVAAVTTPINAQTVAALEGAVASGKHSQDASANSLLTDTSGNSAAGAAQLGTAAGIAADATPAPTLRVAAAVETPEFGQGLADRVSWMVDNNMNGAKLQVNPAQLGPIEVRIAVQGGHAQVWLTSHSAVTRDALEASSPKLREMLGSQGFGQVSVDISQRSFQERPSQTQPYDWTPAANRGASTAPPSAAAVSMPRLSSGVVDAYA